MLLANNALNMQVSNLLSCGKNVMLMYGVGFAKILLPLPFSSFPLPLPAAMSDPSLLAKTAASMGTTEGIRLEN